MDKQHTNYKILLVDKEVSFHQEFRAVLGRYYELDGALNAAGMWEKLHKIDAYDLLCLGLPIEGDSFEQDLTLVAAIKKRYKYLPIIVLSSRLDKTLASQAQQAGASALIDRNNKEAEYWHASISAAAQLEHKPKDNKRSLAPAPKRKPPTDTVLVVDDDKRFHEDFDLYFSDHYRILGAMDEKGMKKLLGVSYNCDLILLDLKLDGENIEIGMNLIPWLRKEYPRIPIVVATADENARIIVEAMKRGAKSFIQKNDTDYEYWRQQINEVIKEEKRIAELAQEKKKSAQLEQENRQLKGLKRVERYAFIGETPQIKEIREKLELLSEEPDLVVLITGETGVGKEVAARYLHSCGGRNTQPFVAVNLSAIPKTLLESALFGSVKGAFTDAKDAEGYFQQANGGVLMLDEIGDIDHDIQVKLLRFLEQRLIRPVGATQDIEVDIQIIAATRKDLNALVEEGRFREDLRYRMNYTVEIPPLRDRRDDILPILEHLFKVRYPGLDFDKMLDPEVVNQIKTHRWPGNIRQLSNVLAHMMLSRRLFKLEKANMSCFDEALKQTTPVSIETTQANALASIPAGGNNAQLDRKEKQAREDLAKIEDMLIQTNNDKTGTALNLGYKGTDHLRSRISVCYKNYPNLLEQFPRIRAQYSSIIQI